jgi:hypothetical protein
VIPAVSHITLLLRPVPAVASSRLSWPFNPRLRFAEPSLHCSGGAGHPEARMGEPASGEIGELVRPLGIGALPQVQAQFAVDGEEEERLNWPGEDRRAGGCTDEAALDPVDIPPGFQQRIEVPGGDSDCQIGLGAVAQRASTALWCRAMEEITRESRPQPDPANGEIRLIQRSASPRCPVLVPSSDNSSGLTRSNS